MADDPKTADGPKPEGSPSSAAPTHAPERDAAKKSEWTASDDRGPLERAQDEADAHEAQLHESPTPPDAVHGPAVTNADTAHHDPAGTHEGAAGDGAASDAPSASPGTATSTGPAATAEPAATPQAAGKPKGRSIWPVAAAVVLGAIIGAGSAYVDGRYLGGGSQDQDVSSLAARVDALEKRPDPQPEIGEIRSSVTALANKVAALRSSGPADQAPAQAQHPAAPAAEKPAETSQAAPPPSPPPTGARTAETAPAVDLGPLNQKIAALRADLDALKTQGADTKGLQDKIAALEGALAGMKTATAAAQAGVVTMEGQQKALAARVMAPAVAVVADSLVQQIDQGEPYAAQVDALAALGVDPAKVTVLRENADKGVPSAKTLAARFEPLAEPIATTGRRPPPNAGFFDRLKSGLLNLVSVRRADDTSGDDLPSRVARIKAALAHDDVPGALATWEALPEDAKSRGAAWGALAKTSADAMTAARTLQHDAIVTLGARKS